MVIHKSVSKMLAAVALMSAISGSIRSFAELPPSLQQLPQDPDVETLIKSMEAKATALGDGVWTTASGAKDSPGVSATTALQGDAWYVKDTVGGKPFLLFSRGEYFFNPATRQRLGLDSIYKNNIASYSQSYLLLHINLRPRQFLGSLPLKIVKGVMVDGVGYIHLRAEIHKDPRKAKDPYLGGPGFPAVIDFYYDSARQGIAQVSTSGPVSFKSTVSTWDNFGTKYAWPALMTCGQGNSEFPAKLSGKPLIVSASKFTPGNDDAWKPTQDEIAAIPFYHAPADELRKPEIYQKMVDAAPTDLTERVVWTQALLRTGGATEALTQWKALEAALPNEADRQILNEVFGPSLGVAIGVGTHDPKQEVACAELLARWADISPASRGVAYYAYVNWTKFATKPACQTILAPVESKLLSNFVASRDVGLLAALMQTSSAMPEKKAAIDAALNELATDSFKAGEYWKSGLPPLIKAAYQAKQAERVPGYLASNSSMDAVSQNLAQMEQAVAAFNNNELSEGLRFWKSFESSVPPITATAPAEINAQKEAQLAKLGDIAVVAARTLGRKESEKQEAASLEIYKRLAETRVQEHPWREASLPVVTTWARLRKSPSNRTALSTSDAAIVQKVATSRNTDSLLFLMQLAARDKKDAALIDPILSKVATAKLPEWGLFNSTQTPLVESSVRLASANIEELPRLEGYLSQLTWDPKTSEKDRNIGISMLAMVEAAKAVPRGNPMAGETLIDVYGAVTSKEFMPGDVGMRAACKAFVEILGAQAIQAKLANSNAPGAVAYLTAGVEKAGAKGYWDGVAVQLKRWQTKGKTPKEIVAYLELVGNFGKSYEQVFKVPDYESQTWVAVGRSELIDPQSFSAMARIDYFNKGFASAKSDGQRYEVLAALSDVLTKNNQYDLAIQTIEQLQSGIQEQEIAGKSALLLTRVKAAKAHYLVVKADEAKKIEADRAAERLKFARERLAEAKKQNRSAEDIAALERTVQQMQPKPAAPPPAPKPAEVSP